MSQAKFASLALFEQNLEFKASLLDTRVDAQLLHNLEPSPAQVFREAHERDGASTDDIKLFLKALKEIRGQDNQPLVTRDGLDLLTNVLWDMAWKERTAGAKCSAQEPRKQPRYGAATWSCGAEASATKATNAKRKAPADSIEHANTHSPGMPLNLTANVLDGGKAELKLSEAARALREGSQLQGTKPALASAGSSPLSAWLKQQEALMAAKGDKSTLSTWLSQQRALMAAQHVSTGSDISAHSGPDCSASEGTGTVAMPNDKNGKGAESMLAATADSSDKLRGANSPYVMLMASMKAAMADAEFQKVKMSVMQFRQSRDTKQFARKLVAAVRNNPGAQTLLPQLAAVVPRSERDTFKAHLQTLVKRIELGLALLSPSQKQAVSELGAAGATATTGTATDTMHNPSTDGTNQTTESMLASPQLAALQPPASPAPAFACDAAVPDPKPKPPGAHAEAQAKVAALTAVMPDHDMAMTADLTNDTDNMVS